MTEPSRRMTAALILSFVTFHAIAAGLGEAVWNGAFFATGFDFRVNGVQPRELIENAGVIVLVYVVSVSMSGSRWNGLVSALSVSCLSLVVSRGASAGESPLMTGCFLLAVWFSALWYEYGFRRWIVGAGSLLGVALAGSPSLKGGALVILILLWRGARRYLLHGRKLLVLSSVFIASVALGSATYLGGLSTSDVFSEMGLSTELLQLSDVRRYLSISSLCLTCIVSGLIGWGMIRKERAFGAGIPILAVSSIALSGLSYPSGIVIGALIPFAAMLIAEMSIVILRRAL